MNEKLMAMVQPELTESEIRELCRAKKDELGFDIEKALFPVNPLLIERTISIDNAVELVEAWASVRASVRDSVRASVWDSVRDSVWDSVWASVRDSVRASVRDSVWAYISSMFFTVEDWHGVDHEKGVNPFSPAIELWENGYLASYDGEVWRLHCGKDADIVWSGSFGEK